MPARKIFSISAEGTGSGENFRILRLVWIISKKSMLTSLEWYNLSEGHRNRDFQRLRQSCREACAHVRLLLFLSEFPEMLERFLRVLFPVFILLRVMFVSVVHEKFGQSRRKVFTGFGLNVE